MCKGLSRRKIAPNRVGFWGIFAETTHVGEPIRLLKTETRLCRNLARVDLADRINRFLACEGSGSGYARFYEIATFYQYAVADGIHRLLFASRTGPLPPPPASDNRQLVLPFAQPPP